MRDNDDGEVLQLVGRALTDYKKYGAFVYLKATDVLELKDVLGYIPYVATVTQNTIFSY